MIRTPGRDPSLASRANPSYRVVAAAAIGLLLFAVSASSALERRTVSDTTLRDSEWTTMRSTSSIAYYNLCTGWAWVWGGFPAGAQLGVVHEINSIDPYADGMYLHFWRGVSAGYGATGLLSLFAVDGMDCPTGAELHSQPFLPHSGWNLEIFYGVSIPQRVASVITLGTLLGSDGTSPVWITSDRPGPGPTGPIACGTCYPTTRESHSYYWGTEESPYCPGGSFHDGFCEAELLAAFLFTGPATAVESQSWGGVKALYR